MTRRAVRPLRLPLTAFDVGHRRHREWTAGLGTLFVVTAPSSEPSVVDGRSPGRVQVAHV